MKIIANTPPQPAAAQVPSVDSTQKEEVSMATAGTPTVSAAPKVSWLKRVGQTIGKILGIVAKDAKPVADTAAQVATALFPQWATLIAAGDGLVTKIAAQATAVEALAAAAGTATGTGTQKLAQVLGDAGPAIDQWVSNAFPGAKQISDATKAGLVSAVVTILNEIEGNSPAL